MKRSTVWLAIACAVLILVVAGFARINFTVSGTRDVANCSGRTMLRLSEAVVEIANAFEAPPAPNSDRAEAVDRIKARAEAMAAQARRCVDG